MKNTLSILDFGAKSDGTLQTASIQAAIDRCFMLGGGVVVKYNANQRYATDALSDGLLRRIAEGAGVKLQSYFNRADLPGGSTLGSISDTRVSVPTVDIGLPQLAMHSANESMAAKDFVDMKKLFSKFFGSTLYIEKNSVSVI